VAVAATMHDVARLAGVSIKTVSNVVNQNKWVSEATRRRVKDVIDELGYTPNQAARSLRGGRAGAISLIIPDIRNPYFTELADAVLRAADRRGLAVMIEQVCGGKDAELDVLTSPRVSAVDGVVYSVLALDQEDAPLLEKIATPMVLLGERIFGSSVDHVTMQNEEAAEAATAHLLDSGRRRIVALGNQPGETSGSAVLRLRGYRRALAAAGVALDPCLVREAWNWHRRDGVEAIDRLLAEGVRFDAVFAFNDALALGALRAVQEAGLRVPEDVAIVGFDGIEECAYARPSLTTIDPGVVEIAETALSFLAERIEDPVAAGPARLHRSPFRLVRRGSTVPGTDRPTR
jgi:DNA-binding LacI/PurR family transcriptional regulator